jgi:hypothetical protein
MSVEQAKKASHLGRVFARYLGNQPEFIQETAKRYIAYNLALGEHWKTPVPAEVRAQIRTGLGNEHFLREHGRAPIDDRERGSFMAKATRQQTTAVAGYDLTFAPVKSVSTLWTLADRDVAKQIEHAHHWAVEATLTWLEDEVLFTRRGRGGIQQVKAKGLIAGIYPPRRTLLRPAPAHPCPTTDVHAACRSERRHAQRNASATHYGDRRASSPGALRPGWVASWRVHRLRLSRSGTQGSRNETHSIVLGLR